MIKKIINIILISNAIFTLLNQSELSNRKRFFATLFDSVSSNEIKEVITKPREAINRVEFSPDEKIENIKNYILFKNKKVKERDAQEIAENIVKFSISSGIRIDVYLALIETESAFWKLAYNKNISTNGSIDRGPGQISSTNIKFCNIQDPDDLYSAHVNIACMTKLLTYLKSRFYKDKGYDYISYYHSYRRDLRNIYKAKLNRSLASINRNSLGGF